MIPAVRSHPYLAARRPRAFAHRGWHVGETEGLENTVAAFTRAAQEGYSYVETDVHATRDGVLVVHHDATLRRVAGHPGVLRALDWADLADVRVRGRERLPRLEEALEAVPGMRFNVDLKSPGSLRPMLDAARGRRRRAAGRRGQHRRGPAARGAAALRRPGGHRGRGPLRAVAAHPLAAAGPALARRRARCGGDLAQLPDPRRALPVVDAPTVRAAHASGSRCTSGPSTAPSEMHRLLDLGVDGLMTDRPDVLRDVLVVRDEWDGPSPGV